MPSGRRTGDRQRLPCPRRRGRSGCRPHDERKARPVSEAGHDAGSRHGERLGLRPLRLLVTWVASAASLLVAAWILPGLSIDGFGGALLAAAVIAVLNAVLVP